MWPFHRGYGEASSSSSSYDRMTGGSYFHTHRNGARVLEHSRYAGKKHCYAWKSFDVRHHSICLGVDWLLIFSGFSI